MARRALRSWVVAATLALLLSGSPLRADPEECQNAIQSYNSALDDLTTALRSYTTCVDDSQGHDDCSIEFSRVRSVQDDFESAVSSYESDCS